MKHIKHPVWNDKEESLLPLSPYEYKIVKEKIFSCTREEGRTTAAPVSMEYISEVRDTTLNA